MEKIVVLQHPRRNNSTLLALLEAVFPECEICGFTPDQEDGSPDLKGAPSGLSVRPKKSDAV